MSSLTDRLDANLAEADHRIQQLNADMSRLDSALPTQRVSIEADIDRRLAELDSRLGRMSTDARNVPRSNRDYYEGEIQSLRDQSNVISRELQTRRKAAGSSVASRQSEQAALNQRRSQAITENLDEAIRLGNDTITTGNVAMATLIDDRSRLENIGQNLDTIDGEAQDGAARAKRMLARAFCNSFLAWIIVVILLGLLGVEIWLKATHKI
jgi:flagellar biosynthesis GTPase FlhF